MNTQQHDTLAANWDPEILASYMARVQKGEDSDEAMSSDDSGSEIEFEDENPVSTAMSDIDIHHPSDIASGDSAFSSEDEFADDALTEKQSTRRELVLGRPTAAILQMREIELKALHLAYMKELDDADEELAELTELGNDFESLIVELRKRSDQEIVSVEKRVMIVQLVSLAQALFRKERQIKHLQK